MTSIIRLKRPRLSPDPYIAPVSGTRGNCALCKSYSDLTENHVPPQTVGNASRLVARSYFTSITANRDLYFGRKFANGVKFRTLCRDCNSKLGGTEDKAIGSFFEATKKMVESPIIISPTVKISAKPNLIYRGLMAHLASASENLFSIAFDEVARDIFFGKIKPHQSSWNLFYWLYLGEPSFLMRSVHLGLLTTPLKMVHLHIVKYYPLAFMFTTEPWFAGMPNMRRFLQEQDEAEFDLPLSFIRVDRDPIWPAAAGEGSVVFSGADTFGILGFKD